MTIAIVPRFFRRIPPILGVAVNVLLHPVFDILRRAPKPTKVAELRHRAWIWLRIAATAGTVAGCSGDPVLPGDPQPAGTLLLLGTAPELPSGLSTYSLGTSRLAPIASEVGALRSRLTPDGLTAVSFARKINENVYRLVSARQPGATVPLLQFASPNGSTSALGLAVDEVEFTQRVAFIEVSYPTAAAQSILRLYRVGSAGWTDTLVYQGALAGLSWHPDGRRLVTTAHETGFGGPGRIAIIDLTSRTVTPIGPSELPALGEAEFSADGRAIVYSRLSDDGLMSELASIGFDGGAPVALPAHFEGWMPTFSPDGRYLAFCRQVQVGINRPPGRFLLRVSDGHLEQVLPPAQYPTLGCINDWVK